MPTDSAPDHLADLDLAPNEASGLVAVGRQKLLDRYGWDRAFWTVLDAVAAQDCVALIGHRSAEGDASGWTIERLAGQRTGDPGDADDAEAIARHDGWVYLFGSHHGGKEGPIRRREQWIGRFAEDQVHDAGDGPTAPVEVADTGFRLHRLINDALRDSDIELLPMGDATRADFIDTTLANLAGTAEEGLVRSEDWTINIEGADFRDDGTLLLGLRYPVAAGGEPVIVQLDGCAGLFEQPRRWPQVEAIWVVDAIGVNGELAGVRDLCVRGEELHLVTGDLDSAGKGSVIRKDHPGGRDTVSTHFRTRLEGSSHRLAAEVVREFPGRPRIEGIAASANGQFFYVSDEDETVRLSCTPLLSGG